VTTAHDLLALMPFAAKLAITIESAEADGVTGRLAWSQDLCTAGGVLHGGALMSLADTLGGACALLNLPEGASTATISSSTNFLRAVRGGEVTGTSRPLHAGRSVIVVQTELRDGAGRLVAQVTQAQAVLSPGPG
jgi:1,4-dihydroxy-2-naphthoyl-CoA hydrolase